MRAARVPLPKVHCLTSIQNYLSQYVVSVRRREAEAAAFGERQADFEYEEEEICGRIEEMKRRLVESLVKEQGRHYQFEGGSSIYNFVGEMFKRNYRILE